MYAFNLTNINWATFRGIFSRTHLVTLFLVFWVNLQVLNLVALMSNQDCDGGSAPPNWRETG
jgi:hypothetical protein